MPAVVIKYKSAKTLRALQDFAKYFDFQIETSFEKKASKKLRDHLPITYAENPNINALAGIWEGSEISLDEIRNKAWGDRG